MVDEYESLDNLTDRNLRERLRRRLEEDAKAVRPSPNYIAEASPSAPTRYDDLYDEEPEERSRTVTVTRVASHVSEVSAVSTAKYQAPPPYIPGSSPYYPPPPLPPDSPWSDSSAPPPPPPPDTPSSVISTPSHYNYSRSHSETPEHNIPPPPPPPESPTSSDYGGTNDRDDNDCQSSSSKRQKV